MRASAGNRSATIRSPFAATVTFFGGQSMFLAKLGACEIGDTAWSFAEYAVLFPLAGLSNPAQGLPATPAQLLRLRLAWVF